MRETTFIKQKKKSWKKFEEMQRKQSADPDKLTDLFVEITDDLSYSRTFYSKRSVRVYLNYLSQLVFLKVNKNRKVKFQKFIRFWTHGLPMEFARSWKAMVLALVVFLGSMLVGIVSSANDIEYATQIMGERYISMTDENIANGDPMAVYHQHGNSAWSSFGITYNNTMVASRTYITGIAAGVPPVIIMVHNGIMLGTFHYYLYHKGVLSESMWVIWIHGVLEIATIIIAGGAGLVLGSGLLFPGTYTRLQSLRISAKRSFKIALSCVFILIISGFIEGSVTRYTGMPMAFKYIIVLGSIALISFYFLAYPIYLYRTKIKPGKFVFNDDIPHVASKKIELEKVREIGEIFNDSLNLYRQVFSDFIKGWVLLSLPLMLGIALVHFFNHDSYNEELFWWVNIQEVLQGGKGSLLHLGYALLLVSPLFTAIYYAVYLYRTETKFSVLGFFKYSLFGFLKLWPLLIFVALVQMFPKGYMIFLGILLVPFIFQFSYLGFYNEEKYAVKFKGGMKLVFKSWFGSIGMFLLQMVIPLIVFSVGLLFSDRLGVNSTFNIDFIVEFMLDHVKPFVQDVSAIANGLNFTIYYMFFSLILSFVLVGLIVQFHSVIERLQAKTLYERLKDFGSKNNLFEQVDEGEY